MRLQCWVDDGERVPSVVSVWPTCDWHEREQFDLMGIVFDGHPNLERLLMPEDWEGHPLRKDYPIGGEPVRFSDARMSVVATRRRWPVVAEDQYEGSRIPSRVPTDPRRPGGAAATARTSSRSTSARTTRRRTASSA